jgi:hypothetical protein
MNRLQFTLLLCLLVPACVARAQSAEVNGHPYFQPTEQQQIRAYIHETYGVRGVVKTTVRATIGQIRDKPVGWGQDFPGFAQRFGSEAGITAIDGTTRLGLETVFHEDTRYIRCHGCSAGAKIENAFLAEVSARHGADGHRLVSLTPVVSSLSGSLIAQAAWYPPGNTRGDAFVHGGTIIAVGFAFHLLDEFVFDHFRKN